jgi:hypothetical protein
MSKTLRLVTLFVMVLLLLSACDLNSLLGQTVPTAAPVLTLPPTQSVISTMDTSLLSTQIAATIFFNLTLTAEADAALGTPSGTNTPIILPADTQTVTPTPTTTATATNTPSPVHLTVSIDNNCRAGPGKVYDSLAILKQGQEATVVGRDTFDNYWIVENPTTGSGTCWIWGVYATVVGDTSQFEESTPPPTPTATP